MIPRRGAPAVTLTVVSAAVVMLLAGCAAEPVTAATETPRDAAAQRTTSPSPPPSPSALPSERVVTLGDSLMSGFGLTARDAWPRLLAERTRVSLVNLACPGMGFVVEGDCGTPYAGLIPAVAALQPDLIIVESSSNDFWQDANEIRFDTADTVERLHDAAPDALVVGLSTIWNDDPDVPADTGVTSDALRDAVEAVGGTYIDIGQPLVGHPEWLQTDGVHPTAGGQRAIEEAVASALREAGVLP